MNIFFILLSCYKGIPSQDLFPTESNQIVGRVTAAGPTQFFEHPIAPYRPATLYKYYTIIKIKGDSDFDVRWITIFYENKPEDEILTTTYKENNEYICISFSKYIIKDKYKSRRSIMIMDGGIKFCDSQ